MPHAGLAWIARDTLEEMLAEASLWDDRETGGVLLGYWASTDQVVITKGIGPGPAAIHHRTRFRPDQAHHEEEIASHFRASEGRESYLGDWHTHPGTTRPYLSAKDRRAAKNIASAIEARAPNPLMLVLAGDGRAWTPGIWVGDVRGFGRALSWIKLTELQLRPY
jgi:integrative and conjugative element protein (TIGR02256 family)